MSKFENNGENSNKFKRKAESDEDDDEVGQLTNQNKRIFIEANEANRSGNGNEESSAKRRILLEAMKKVEKIQMEMNKLNNSQEDDEEFSSDENDDFHNESDTEDYSSDDELFNGNLQMSAEALGFAMCARETFKFLKSFGIQPTDPIYVSLKNKLVGLDRN